MEFNQVSQVEEFSHGHRGIIYKGLYKKKNVIIKVAHPQSTAVGNIEREAQWLKKLNKHNIGPKIYLEGEGYFVEEFIEGQRIDEFLKKENPQQIALVLKEVLGQCLVLDSLQINKEEMHRPYKHILISDSLQVVMIDFERCRKTEKPQNVTQFVQYLCSTNVQRYLQGKMALSPLVLRPLAEEYKRSYEKKYIDQLVEVFL